ncbi:MAG TPA: 50S ribosomal protein L10 [Planctomycetota bacterium]|jgi:large subunit ribosomal protein L10|nr:50S ribosomal protein L10 [Planctomycetota bacterium]
MAKELKNIIFREIDRTVGGMNGCILIDYKGINSELTHDLRHSLARNGIEMMVVQNRIARRVFKERGMSQGFQDLLKGPTAVLYSPEGTLTASKTIVAWRKKNQDLASIKGGLFEGRAISPAEVEQLAKLPDANTLRQSVLASFLSPLSFLASASQSLLSHFAGSVKAHREALEKGGPPAGGEGAG